MDSLNKRIQREIKNLQDEGYSVELVDTNMNIIFIKFHGPPGSLYDGGVWKISIDFTEDFPRKAPKVKFVNHIYHPNVAGPGPGQEESRIGSVCLNLLGKEWKPEFALSSIIGGGLSWLLRHPNEEDPTNPTAAYMYHHDRDRFNNRVREYIAAYARDAQMAGFQ